MIIRLLKREKQICVSTIDLDYLYFFTVLGNKRFRLKKIIKLLDTILYKTALKSRLVYVSSISKNIMSIDYLIKIGGWIEIECKPENEFFSAGKSLYK